MEKEQKNNQKNSFESHKKSKKERRVEKRREKHEKAESQRQAHSYKLILIWTSVFVVIALGIFGVVKVASHSTGENGNAIIANSVTAEDWTKGSQDETAVILVEYSDFQCPACGSYFPLLSQLNKEFGDRIKFVYRHFPLSQIHPNANIAARASEAAGNQSKFWEMHDMLFENQSAWSNVRNPEDIFVEYATSINLDIEKFKNDLNDRETKEKVSNDYTSGLQSGVNSTPSFFIDGEKIHNPQSYDQFSLVINQAYQKNLEELVERQGKEQETSGDMETGAHQ